MLDNAVISPQNLFKITSKSFQNHLKVTSKHIKIYQIHIKKSKNTSKSLKIISKPYQNHIKINPSKLPQNHLKTIEHKFKYFNISIYVCIYTHINNNNFKRDQNFSCGQARRISRPRPTHPWARNFFGAHPGGRAAQGPPRRGERGLGELATTWASCHSTGQTIMKRKSTKDSSELISSVELSLRSLGGRKLSCGGSNADK